MVICLRVMWLYVLENEYGGFVQSDTSGRQLLQIELMVVNAHIAMALGLS